MSDDRRRAPRLQGPPLRAVRPDREGARAARTGSSCSSCSPGRAHGRGARRRGRHCRSRTPRSTCRCCARRAWSRAAKEGLYVHYRLADDDGLSSSSRRFARLAERRLAELERVVREHFGDAARSEPVAMEELLARVRSGEVVVLDVRPVEEYRGRAHRRARSRCRSRSSRRGSRSCRRARRSSRTAAARTASMRDRGRRAAAREKGVRAPSAARSDGVVRLARARASASTTQPRGGTHHDLQALLLLRHRLRRVPLRLRRPRQVRRRRRAGATTSTPTSRSPRRRACASRT